MKERTEVGDPSPNNVEAPAVVSGLPAVAPHESGFGHPYAPQNWPNPGDNWRWKVGSRISKQDHFLDRYLQAPKHLPQPRSFASKSSLERYIRTEFPDTDVDAFFAMFSWNIPAKRPNGNGPISDRKVSSSSNSSRDMKGDSETDSQTTKCPAGRKSCKGLLFEAEKPTKPCNMCCSVSGFCRHCTCILCSKTVESVFGGYDYFRCEAVVDEVYICGHIAHLNCALQCELAGTLEMYKLDAAYYCRRCDSRSDLIPHATKILEICRSIDSVSDLENILKLGINILRGSERERAQMVLWRVETAFNKLKNGSPLNSIWEAEENTPIMPPRGLGNKSEVKARTKNMESLVFGTAGQNKPVADSPAEKEIDPPHLEEEIFDTLQSLKKSQEIEYQQAEESLNNQKTYLINLQEQLQYEKSQLAALSSSTEQNAMLDLVTSRTEQIRRELKKLKEMQEICKTIRKLP